MFLSTPAKIFHAAWFFSIVFAGCSLWRSNEDPAGASPPAPKNEYPFAAYEPEVFQAEIVVRTGEIERRTFIARNGEMRRMDFDLETDNQRAVIITDKEYLVYFKQKVFEEHAMESNAADLYEPLTADILNPRDYTSFDEVSRDGSVVQFRARVNGSVSSEVLIFFDEKIGLPVRQEFYSIEGDQRTQQYSVELKGFRPEAKRELFTVPSGFRRQAPKK